MLKKSNDNSKNMFNMSWTGPCTVIVFMFILNMGKVKWQEEYGNNVSCSEWNFSRSGCTFPAWSFDNSPDWTTVRQPGHSGDCHYSALQSNNSIQIFRYTNIIGVNANINRYGKIKIMASRNHQELMLTRETINILILFLMHIFPRQCRIT